MDRGQVVQDLFDSFCKAHPLRSRQVNQEACHAFWRSIKDKPDCGSLARVKIRELRFNSNSPSGTLMKFFKPTPVPKFLSQLPTMLSSKTSKTVDIASSSNVEPLPQCSVTTKEVTATVIANRYTCPKQEKLKKELEAMNAEMNCLLLRERNAIMSVEQEKQLKVLQKKMTKTKVELKKLQLDQERQRQFRTQRKRALDDACGSNPALAKKLKFRKDVGRPAIETDQPQFIKTLFDIAQHGASADDRRRYAPFARLFFFLRILSRNYRLHILFS